MFSTFSLVVGNATETLGRGNVFPSILFPNGMLPTLKAMAFPLLTLKIISPN